MATTRKNLQAFLDRPWDALRVSKDLHTARVARTKGAAATLQMADQLRLHATALGALPTAADRAADLAAAVRLRKLLDRAHRRSPRSR